MAALSPADIQALKAAGFSPGQIQQISAGTANTALLNNAKKHLGQDPQSRYKVSEANAPTDMSPGGWGALGAAIGGGVNPKGWADFYGFGTSGQQRNNSDFAGGQRSVAPADYLTNKPAPVNVAAKPKLGAYGTDLNYGAYEKAASKSYVDPDPKHNSWGGTYGTNEGAPGGPPIPTAESQIPGFPDLPTSEAPQIVAKDYTEEARRLADEAFAPLFAAYEQNKTNVGNQGENSRKIVGGLYENMVRDIAEQAAVQDSQYNDRKAAVTAGGEGLQANIGANYQSANQGTADLLKSLGIEAAAPELLQAGANDQAYQQSQAAGETNNQQNYFNQQQQGAADYNQKQGQITQGAGAVAQQDILAGVAQALAGIDQQIAGSKTDSIKTALDMANTMTDRDIGVQTSNAGLAQSAQQAARQEALAKYQAEVDNARYTDSRADADWQRQVQQREQDRADAALRIEQATAQSKAGASAPVDYTGPLAAKNQIISSFGDVQGTELFNIAQNLVGQAPDRNDTAIVNKLYQSAQQYAQQHPGTDVNAVVTAMLQVYGATLKG